MRCINQRSDSNSNSMTPIMEVSPTAMQFLDLVVIGWIITKREIRLQKRKKGSADMGGIVSAALAAVSVIVG